MKAQGLRGWKALLVSIGFTVAFVLPRPSLAARAFEVDDLFELESISDAYGGPDSFSRDGRRLAITRLRPKKALANHKWEYLWDAGGDVWVQLSATGPLQRITNGVQDGSGWFAPRWSPDGESLAMLSTRGGNVGLWVWTAKTGELAQLSQRPVAVIRGHPYLWLDSENLVYPSLPPGEMPHAMSVEIQTPRIATKAWQKVPPGIEVTASVLESAGSPPDEEGLRELRIVNVKARVERVVTSGRTWMWRVSPGSDLLAFARKRPMEPPQPGHDLVDREKWDVDVYRTATSAVQARVFEDVLPRCVRWSSTAPELAALGYDASRTHLVLRTWNAHTRRAHVIPLPGLAVEQGASWSSRLEWLGQTGWVVRAESKGKDLQWWFVSKDGHAVSATPGLPASPTDVWPEAAHTLLAVAGGDLWRMDPLRGKSENLTLRFAERVRTIKSVRGPTREQAYITFSAAESSASIGDYVLTGRDVDPQPLLPPGSGAEITTISPSGANATWRTNGPGGLRVWRSNGVGGQATLLYSSNMFLKDIDEGEFRRVEYTSLDGLNLAGWLILPRSYQEGKRYPLIVWVYPGSSAVPTPPAKWRIHSYGAYNLQIAAAHGYAVLIPEVLLNAEGSRDDPMLRLTSSVLPAVTRIVDMGIADSREIFLLGHSYGGYAAYGLITQTNRFAAAVAMAGATNLISYYGSFDARERYKNTAHQREFTMTLLESTQGRMGNPPWEDLGRYVRNSPIFQVQRVETPLLIIQGDMDYVPIQQGEEFFSALYRQGKPARFVRYWGEGHVIESPANIRDMWKQIFTWLDAHSTRAEQKKYMH